MFISSAFLMVVLCLAGGGFNTLEAKSLVTFKKNIDQVLKEWNCNKPQGRLVYLGMYLIWHNFWRHLNYDLFKFKFKFYLFVIFIWF